MSKQIMSLLVVSLLSTLILTSVFMIIPLAHAQQQDNSDSDSDSNPNSTNDETASTSTDDFAASGMPSIPHVCFAPEGPTAQSQAMIQKIESLQTESESSSNGRTTRYRYLGNRWSSTSRSGNNLIRGQPTTISWSVVPDGTYMTSPLGEAAGNSSVISFLSKIYGNPGYINWIQSVLDMWSAVSGLTYLHEPNDDGAPMKFDGSNPGAIGIRGDMRIAGHPIDGNSGILAYCYSPNVGDMVIDTNDNFYSLKPDFAANVIVHESGHGFGLGHTCPTDNTKLMEPYLSTSFLGPQHDDIRGAHRLYGDKLEPNNDVTKAKAIGLADNGISYLNLSLDDITDVDFFSFDVNSKTNVTITIVPVGKSYMEAAVPSSTTTSNSNPCTGVGGVAQDSRNVIDLAMSLYNSAGNVMQTMNANGVGGNEVLRIVLNPSTTYKLKVHPASVSVTLPAAGMYVQMYSISITATTATTTTNPVGGGTSITPSASTSRSPAATPSKSSAATPSKSSAATPSKSVVSVASPSRSPSHSSSHQPVSTPSRSPSRSASRSASHTRLPSRSRSPYHFGSVAEDCPPPVVEQPLYTTMEITSGDKVLMNCQCVPVSS